MVPFLPFRKQFFSSSGPHWAEAGRARGGEDRREGEQANDVLHGHGRVSSPYLKNRLPDGWTDPWIAGWQCMQPWLKAYRDIDG